MVTYIGINKVLKILKINYVDNSDIDLAIVKSAQIHITSLCCGIQVRRTGELMLQLEERKYWFSVTLARIWTHWQEFGLNTYKSSICHS